jgi:hypothetical protein
MDLKAANRATASVHLANDTRPTWSVDRFQGKLAIRYRPSPILEDMAAPYGVTDSLFRITGFGESSQIEPMVEAAPRLLNNLYRIVRLRVGNHNSSHFAPALRVIPVVVVACRVLLRCLGNDFLQDYIPFRKCLGSRTSCLPKNLRHEGSGKAAQGLMKWTSRCYAIGIMLYPKSLTDNNLWRISFLRSRFRKSIVIKGLRARLASNCVTSQDKRFVL